jgi:hypothetical protein
MSAGHGYLLSALPPPAQLLQAMADQVEGNSQLMQAAMTLAVEMLRLVPLLLGACAHLSPEMPLQQYWGVVSAGLHDTHIHAAVYSALAHALTCTA